MLEIILLDTQPPQLSNYNSLYELFAGLSAALTGVETLRLFLLNKLKKNYSKEQDELTSSIEWCDAFCDEFTRGTHEKDVTGAQHETLLKNDRKKLNDDLAELQKLEKTEDGRNDRIASSFFTYIFCSCVSWMFITGFQADGFLTIEDAVRKIANYELLSIPALFALLLVMLDCPRLSLMPVRAGVITSAIVMALAYLLPNGFGIANVWGYYSVVIISFAICLFPIVIMLFKGVPKRCHELRSELKLHLMQVDEHIKAAKLWLVTKEFETPLKNEENNISLEQNVITDTTPTSNSPEIEQ